MSNYQGVCLPKNLLDLIQEKAMKHGYTSRSDFIKSAVREKLERLERRGNKQ